VRYSEKKGAFSEKHENVQKKKKGTEEASKKSVLVGRVNGPAKIKRIEQRTGREK